MLYISLLVEALRARPAAMFWTATLSQALLWTLVPAIFYAAPPGDVPLLLAIGHHWPLGSSLGPPLANWLGEIAFDLTGGRVTGVYLLSQGCVIVTFWAVFALGRSIVGTRHAVMAVLLMVGIVAFSMPTPEFGPAVLAMPLTALGLLHAWRAVAEGRRRHWLALGVDLGLLLLTTYAGLILIALIIGFIAATPRGRAAVGNVDAWAAGMIVVLIVFPHLIWAESSGTVTLPSLAGHPFGLDGPLVGWLKLVAVVLAAHALMLVLLVVAGGVHAPDKTVPVFERSPPDPLAKTFVYTFALAPVSVATLIAALFGQPAPVGGTGSVIVLSGLAVVLAAGDVIRLHRERFVGVAWLALLLAPAVVVMAGATLLPALLAVDLEIGQPVSAMGQFFTDSFRRRTGKPLEIVVGDPRLAGAIALASPDRPSLFVAASPELTPWVSEADIRRKGAVLVWPATDSAGLPPDAIKARFPGIVPELPRAFDRPVQGRLPLLRVGWAVIRPSSP
jgi:4-amino-4-deoxy-L-arabinose transferase-like glycosyltransferase